MIDGTCNLNWMKPNQEGQKKIEALREVFITAEAHMRELLNPGRESSLALTKLEETVMWATKSICIATKE